MRGERGHALAQQGVGETRPVVFDGEFQCGAVAPTQHPDVPALGQHLRRVEQQVEHALAQAVGRQLAGTPGGDGLFDVDVGCDLVARQRHHFVDRLLQHHALRRFRRMARTVEQTVHQPGEPAQFSGHRVDPLLRGGIGQVVLEIGECERHAGERVAQLVRQAGGEFADRRELVGLRQAAVVRDQLAGGGAHFSFEAGLARDLRRFDLGQPRHHVVVASEQRGDETVGPACLDARKVMPGESPHPGVEVAQGFQHAATHAGVDQTAGEHDHGKRGDHQLELEPRLRRHLGEQGVVRTALLSQGLVQQGGGPQQAGARIVVGRVEQRARPLQPGAPHAREQGRIGHQAIDLVAQAGEYRLVGHFRRSERARQRVLHGQALCLHPLHGGGVLAQGLELAEIARQRQQRQRHRQGHQPGGNERGEGKRTDENTFHAFGLYRIGHGWTSRHSVRSAPAMPPCSAASCAASGVLPGWRIVSICCNSASTACRVCGARSFAPLASCRWR